MERSHRVVSDGRRSRGSVLSLVLSGLAMVTIVVIGVIGARSSVLPAAARTSPSTHELMAVLGRLQLTPELLTAAGATPTEAGTIVDNMRTHLDARMTAWREAEANLQSLTRENDRLQTRVQSGQATPQERTAYETGLASLAAARAAMTQLLDNARTAALAGLGESCVTAWQLASGNARDHDVPTRYLFAGRTEAQWVALRDALANQRIAAKRGVEPDGQCAALIAACDAEAGTVAASVNLSSNLQSVTEAWDAAVEGN